MTTRCVRPLSRLLSSSLIATRLTLVCVAGCTADSGVSAATSGAAADAGERAREGDAKGTQVNAADGGAPASQTPPEGPATVDLPAAETLLAKHIEAIGGTAAIDAIDSFHERGSIDTGAQNIVATSEIWWTKRGFYVRQEVPGFGSTESGFDGTTAWSRDPIHGLRTIEGAERDQLLRSSDVFEIAHHERFYATAKTIGAGRVDDRDVWQVELTTTAGEKVTVGLDQQDGLLRSVDLVQVSPMGDQPVKVVRKDHRRVGDVMWPYATHAHVGLFTLVQTTEIVEFNGPVDDSKFAMPGPATRVDPKGAQLPP